MTKYWINVSRLWIFLLMFIFAKLLNMIAAILEFACKLWHSTVHWQNLKIFFSKTTRPISTKLSTIHPWVKGIQVSSNEGHRHFLRGDYYEIAKIHRQNLNIFFSKHHWANFNQIWHKASLSEEDSSFSNEEPFNFRKVGNGFSSTLLQLFELFSQVTNGPIVIICHF